MEVVGAVMVVMKQIMPPLKIKLVSRFLKKKRLILYYKGYSRSFVIADFKRFKSLDMDFKVR